MKSLHVNRQDVMSDSHRQQQPRGIHNKEIAVMLSCHLPSVQVVQVWAGLKLGTNFKPSLGTWHF